MLIDCILLLISFYLLYKGANWLVDGASGVASRLGISKVVVGVTMVAFGTSAPELFVNIIAAARGKTDFALSNVSGSNLTNLCIGFGICSLLGTLSIKRSKFLFDLCLFFISPMIILFFLGVYPKGYIPLWAVFFLVAPFVFYIHSLKFRLFEKHDIPLGEHRSLAKSFAFFFIGVASLYISGELILKAAVSLGHSFGVSDAVMGLTIVAAGTSIPDVTASIIAFKKNEDLIAVGNLIGSNIFNLLLVLSATLLVSFKGLAASNLILMDYSMVFVSSLIFALVAIFRQKLGKFTGLILFVGYFAYMIFRVMMSMYK